jgi:hypothetical protein
MTVRPDAPEASNAPEAPEAAASAGGEATNASRDAEAKDPQLGRRKLLYAAPAIMSQSMFYALAGCGKAQPQQLNCFRVPRSGS